MKSIKIIMTLLVIILSFTLMQSECYAKNYYAMTEYIMEAKTGNVYSMMVVSRIFDATTCQAVEYTTYAG